MLNLLSKAGASEYVPLNALRFFDPPGRIAMLRIDRTIGPCTFQTDPLAINQPFPHFCPFISTTSAPPPQDPCPSRVNLKVERPRCAVCRSPVRDLFEI